MDFPASSLPIDVVGHIQSFMNFRDAARIATTCTGLYETWRYQRNIDFDQREFRDTVHFWVGVTKTMRMYADSGRTVDRVTIRIQEPHQFYIDTTKLVEDVANLGAVEINIFLFDDNFRFIIPDVVFTNERVERLSVIGGCANVAMGIPRVCRTMKSMVIRPAHFLGYKSDLLTKYVLRCPNLEQLECPGTMLWHSSLRSSSQSHNLLTLLVEGLSYQDHWFLDSIQFFPRLKVLTINGVRNAHEIRISSPTIESLVVRDRHRSIHAVLDLPNLRTFHFECSVHSRLQFSSPMDHPAIEIEVVCFKSDDEWFSSLHALMVSIPRSRLNLSVIVMCDDNVFSCDFEPYEPLIDLDELYVRVPKPEPELLIGLFRLCAPTCFRYYDVEGNDLSFPYGFLIASTAVHE